MTDQKEIDVKVINLDSTLAELVNQQPALARQLERFGLDYCCGGRRTLKVACAAVGLDPDTVIKALSAVEPAAVADWTTMAPAALADHLEATHHAFLWTELPRLAVLADKVAAAHGARHPELAAVVDTLGELRADLEPHLHKEERVLFPMIRELAATTPEHPPSFHCGSFSNPISAMVAEHDRAATLLDRLRRLTDSYTIPADGCATFDALYRGLAEIEADTHLHVHKENNLLFPAVLELEAAATAASFIPNA